MAIQKHDPHWWSDIVRTEIRLPHRCSRRLCILPVPRKRVGSTRITFLRKLTRAFLLKIHTFLARRPKATSTVSCADPAEAYMNACLAAPPFCYVSPAIYGLTNADNQRDLPTGSSRPGDEA
jgi:hypothetical protein